MLLFAIHNSTRNWL